MGTYNSTQFSATEINPHMMLTGHEMVLPVMIFYHEYEGKKTWSQVYERDVIRRLQELNVLCRRNTQQAQARRREASKRRKQVQTLTP